MDRVRWHGMLVFFGLVFFAPPLSGQELIRGTSFGTESPLFVAERQLVEAPLIPILPPGELGSDAPSERRDFSGYGGGRGRPGYSVAWYPTRPIKDQPGNSLGMLRQNLSVGAPVWLSDSDKLIATVSVQNTSFSTDVVLPDTGRAFPDALWNIRFGVNYFRTFENGWKGGLIVQAGSASDRPFHSTNELIANVIGFLEIPAQNERDAWQFSVFYSPFGNLSFPIPGFAYLYRPSDTFQAQIGIPFRIDWRPTETFSWDFSYVPLTNISTQARWTFAPKTTAFLGYEFLNDAYFLADRPVRRDRFMVFEQRVVGGIRWQPWRKLVFDAHLGYSFGRSFGEGRNQGGDLRDELDLSPGPFLGTDLTWRF